MKKFKLLMVTAAIALTAAFPALASGKQETAGAQAQAAQVQLSTTTSVPATVVQPGTYRIGVDIPAGEYVLLCNSEYEAYYEVTSDTSGKITSIIDNENFVYNSVILVHDGEYLQLKGCTLSPVSEVPQIDYTKGNKFKVGYHIPAGTYKLQTSSEYSGYYEVLNELGGGIQRVESNDVFDGQAYVTVADGQYLVLKQCNIVSKN